jgi:hypothetical protein
MGCGPPSWQCPDTNPEHLADVVAYLLSPAGAYFSGARLDLGSPSR